jgi:plastocyanin
VQLRVALRPLLIAAAAALVALAGSHAPARASGAAVSIDDATSCLDGSVFCYRPAALTVGPNTTITVTNSSVDIHSLTRCTVAACGAGNVGDGPQSFDTGHLSSGATARITLKHPGTYVYYCTIHGYSVMHGSFTVGH